MADDIHQEQEPAAEWVPIAHLVGWKDNPRKNDHAVQPLVDSIKRFGFGAPVVARKADGMIIAGHTRVKAALELRMTDIPVRFLDITEEDAKLLALADNKLAELSRWDDHILADVLHQLMEDGANLNDIGFSDAELQEIMGLGAEMPDEDFEVTEPELDAVVHSKPGEVYQLGPHRLVCGDSTDPAVWSAVLGQERPAVVLTDPPYGLGDTESTKNNYQTYQDSTENLTRLIEGWLPIAKERCDVVVFTPGNGNVFRYPEPTWTMAWFTPAGVGRGPWGFCCWQPILCYGKDPSLASGNGCRPDALVHTEAAEDLEHPCPKPINLWIWLLERVSFQANELVLDPFGGSGTTLMAAAKTGKVARLIEIDPRYCDLIRRRWTRYAEKAGLELGEGALGEAE